MQELFDLGFIELRNRPSGIYALCRGDEVIYIGQSVNVYSRVREHYNHRQQKYWDRVFVLWCSPVDLNRTETQMIHHFRPEHNRHIPTGDTAPTFDLLAALGLQTPRLERRD